MRQQARKALDAGNRVRIARAEAKRRLAEHPDSFVEQLQAGEWPPELERWKVWDALRCLPGIHKRVAPMLHDAGIVESKTLGGLTERQRKALVEQLLEHRRRCRRWRK